MAVTVGMHNPGSRELRRDVAAMIEHVLADRSGDWRVSIIGSKGSDRWEMKIHGPNGFERSYTLEGAAGQHEPHVDCEVGGKNGAEALSGTRAWSPPDGIGPQARCSHFGTGGDRQGQGGASKAETIRNTRGIRGCLVIVETLSWWGACYPEKKARR